MKHAGRDTLAKLAPLLKRLRATPGLKEKSPGSFYVGAAAFLHFHEDPAGVFVDVKLNGSSFSRLQLKDQADESKLLAKIATPIARLQRSRPTTEQASELIGTVEPSASDAAESSDTEDGS